MSNSNNYIDKEKRCSCGGEIETIYFRDKKGKQKKDYDICILCLKTFVTQ